MKHASLACQEIEHTYSIGMSGGITGILGNKGGGMPALLEKQFVVGDTLVSQLRDSENKFSPAKA